MKTIEINITESTILEHALLDLKDKMHKIKNHINKQYYEEKIKSIEELLIKIKI